MDVYVDYSGKHAHAWAATVVLRSGRRIMLGGPLPPQSPGTIWRGEEQAYFACRSQLQAFEATYHCDEAHTCSTHQLTYVDPTNPFHLAAHHFARHIRTYLDQLPPPAPPPTFDPVRYAQLQSHLQQLPLSMRAFAQSRLATLHQRASTPLSRTKSKNLKRRTKHARHQHLAIQEVERLLLAPVEELERWATTLLQRHVQRQERVEAARIQHLQALHQAAHAKQRAAGRARSQARALSPWVYQGALPLPFSRAAPLTLTTPTGRPRNTIRERLLQHIHHTPQQLKKLSPTISTCRPATAIAAALILHAEGQACVTQLPSGELTIARR